MEDFPQEFLLESCSMNIEFLENKIGEITVGVYLLFIAETVKSALQIGTSALLFC